MGWQASWPVWLATAVLATSTVAAADRAGPGDLLAGLDRSIESLQLALAGDGRDAELLVDFATERVLEALDRWTRPW